MPRHALLVLCSLASLFANLAAYAQGVPPSTPHNEPRAFQPIIGDAARLLPAKAKNGMVASQEAKATRIGVDILRRGGNAVDAAVAVGFALAVTLPRAGNLGGGGFMLVHLANGHETIAVDYREIAPAAATSAMFLDEKGEPIPQKSRDSGLAIGVPGTVRGLALAHENYGSGKFKLAELIAPAIALARDGIIVDEDLADSLPQAGGRLGRHAPTRAIFFAGDKPLAPGTRLIQSDLASTLSIIAEQGADAFYRGPIAEKIAASVTSLGGVMTKTDLENYRVVLRRPLRGTYRGHDIVSMPPPSSGGVHLIEILNILEGVDLAASGPASAATLHWLTEAMKPAYADRAQFLGDPDRVKIPVKGLTAKDYAERLRLAISPDRARKADDIKAGNPLAYESDQTTHFSVVDSAGNAVANTYTLNFSYGVGLVAEGTGVLLNNEMDDFSAKPGAQNAYGLVGSDANSVSPGARPLSSMTPTFVFKEGRLVLVTGSPGGSRIISTTLQVISNVIDHGMNIAEAVTAPRIHHQWRPDFLLAETGFSPDTLRSLEAKGHTIRIGTTSGSASSIHVTAEGLMGAADPRQRGTLAAGY